MYLCVFLRVPFHGQIAFLHIGAEQGGVKHLTSGFSVPNSQLVPIMPPSFQRGTCPFRCAKLVAGSPFKSNLMLAMHG